MLRRFSGFGEGPFVFEALLGAQQAKQGHQRWARATLQRLRPF
jgi:hypothetical protein